MKLAAFGDRLVMSRTERTRMLKDERELPEGFWQEEQGE